MFSNIFAEDTIANSNYNGLQISLEKNYSHGLLFQASYTFSKAIDQGASFENELNPLNYNATRGLSLLDAKNRFVFSPVWELPIPKYEGVKGKVARRMGRFRDHHLPERIPDSRAEPGRPRTREQLFLRGCEHAGQLTGPIHVPKSEERSIERQPPIVQYILTQLPDSDLWDVWQHAPRSLLRAAPISNTDLVISKKTPINERWNTEFRAEFYNTWNHTQFANPDGNFTNSNVRRRCLEGSRRSARHAVWFEVHVLERSREQCERGSLV